MISLGRWLVGDLVCGVSLLGLWSDEPAGTRHKPGPVVGNHIRGLEAVAPVAGSHSFEIFTSKHQSMNPRDIFICVYMPRGAGPTYGK
jgi:hypothetical protein